MAVIKRIVLILILCLVLVGGASATYVSQYPPAQSFAYVNSTTFVYGGLPYWVTNPALSVVGAWTGNTWAAGVGSKSGRLNIDLGSAKIIKNIKYVNIHNSGGETESGVKNFTFWGSNVGTSWSNLADDTGWTQITASQLSFDQHVASNVADWKNVSVTNTNAYRNYSVKYANNWGGVTVTGMRRIELQTDEAPVASFTANATSGSAPLAVLLTDTSTPAASSWAWGAKNFTPGNNTWFRIGTTTPLATTLGVGNWSINLTATNAAGSDLSDQITWINVTGLPPRSTIQTITHDFGTDITYALVTLTKPGEVFSVSNLTSTTFDLTITNAVSGLAGTNQTVYWCVG